MTSLFIKFTIEPSAGVPVKQEITATIAGHTKLTDRKNKPVSECWSLNCPQILVGEHLDKKVAAQQVALYKKEGDFFLSVQTIDTSDYHHLDHIHVKDVMYTTGIFASLK